MGEFVGTEAVDGIARLGAVEGDEVLEAAGANGANDSTLAVGKATGGIDTGIIEGKSLDTDPATGATADGAAVASALAVGMVTAVIGAAEGSILRTAAAGCKVRSDATGKAVGSVVGNSLSRKESLPRAANSTTVTIS